MTSMPPRWRVAALLFVGAAINYLDRACISAVSPAIKQQFDISDARMGLVFSSFFVGYASMNVIGGWAADRFGAKKVLAVSLVTWSCFCAATAAVTGFASLLVTRALFGAAEGPFGAASAAAVNGWFPKREIARAIAAITSGTAAGAIVAGPLVALAYAALGWRGSLIAVSVVGLVFAVVWLRFGVEADPAATRDAARAASSRSEPYVGPGRWRATARHLWHPPLVANALAYFAYTYLLAVYLSWLPLFFTAAFRFKIEGAALSSALPWSMAFCGIWAGTFLAEFVHRRTGRLGFSRRVVQVGALLVAGFGTAALGWVATPAAATAVASLSLFALFLSGTSYWAVVQDLVPARAVGTVSGLTHFVANLGGIVGPALTGALVQHSAGSFRSSWATAGLIAFGAVACVLVATRFRAPHDAIDAHVGA